MTDQTPAPAGANPPPPGGTNVTPPGANPAHPRIHPPRESDGKEDSPTRDSERRPEPPPRPKSPIPQVDELLERLLQLNGAVLMGAMSVKNAAFIQKNLKAVLDAQIKRTSPSDSSPSQEALADLCRRDPQAITAVAPFLSHEQLQDLMGQITDESHEPL